MGAFTDNPPTFAVGEKAGVAAKLNTLRDFARAFTDAFTAYTPTLKDSTNATLANWTCTGRYFQAGKLVLVQFDLLAGSSPGVGTGAWRINLPVNARTGVPQPWHQAGGFTATDASPLAFTTGRISIDGAGYFGCWYQSALVNGSQTALAGGAPITWAANDRITGSFWYEAA